MDTHNAAVGKISARVKEFYDQKKGFRIYHGSTNTTRRSNRSADSMVDLSMLNHVVSVDTDKKTALVEPNVPMDALVAETLNHGLVPPVVMEFPGITAGGGFAGIGGESSSFLHGTFDRTVNRVEIVLANGEIVWAGEEERADLFAGSAGAFGTLGVLTLLEVQLVPAQGKKVELCYHVVDSVKAATDKCREMCNEESTNDFVDGIMYSAASGVIITGRMVAQGDDKKVTATYTRSMDNWYYSDVEEKLRRNPEGWTDVVPVEDYFFRYDRGAFWCGRYTFYYFRLPFNTATRWLLDGLMHTRDLFNALHSSGGMIKAIIQDLCVPARNLEAFVEYTTEEFNIWPLWFCPMNPNSGRGIFQLSPIKEGDQPGHKGDLWINVGLWGAAPVQIDEAIAANRRLEQKLKDLGGYKWLYAQTFYTEDEFWRIYPREEYEALRKKYNATSLPSAYDKIKTEVDNEVEVSKTWRSRWPFEAIIGYIELWKGKNSLVGK